MKPQITLRPIAEPGKKPRNEGDRVKSGRCTSTFVKILAAVLVMAVATVFLSSLDSLKAKETTTVMKRFAKALHIEISRSQSSAFDLESRDGAAILEALQKRYPSSGEIEDGWGNRLMLERANAVAGRNHWEIRSLGRDGVRGGCCTRFLNEKWDEDAVIFVDVENGVQWLQAW